MSEYFTMLNGGYWTKIAHFMERKNQKGKYENKFIGLQSSRRYPASVGLIVARCLYVIEAKGTEILLKKNKNKEVSV